MSNFVLKAFNTKEAKNQQIRPLSIFYSFFQGTSTGSGRRRTISGPYLSSPAFNTF
jgi:hypothetical protein